MLLRQEWTEELPEARFYPQLLIPRPVFRGEVREANVK
jgi:hypothetical protein